MSNCHLFLILWLSYFVTNVNNQSTTLGLDLSTLDYQSQYDNQSINGTRSGFFRQPRLPPWRKPMMFKELTPYKNNKVYDKVSHNKNNVDDDDVGNITSSDHLMPHLLVLVSGMYGECGQISSCMSYPLSCHRTEKCLVTLAYHVQKDGRIHFIMSGTTFSYIAIGFSKDNRMGDDAVVICRKTNSAEQVEIWQAYNLSPFNKGTQAQMNNSAVLEIAGAYNNGVVSCEFSLASNFVTENDLKIDFANQKYHIQLALGNKNKAPDGPGSITVHGFKTMSKNPVNLTSREFKIIDQATHRSITAHEILSILTYGFLTPFGIFVARYGQQAFPYKIKLPLIRNFPTWVLIHMTCNSLGIIFVILNILILYIGRVGSTFSTSSSFYHAVIGPIVFLSSIANFAIGCVIHMYKANKGPFPVVLKWIHWFLGHFAYTFGVVEMIRGPYLKKSWISCSFSVIVGLSFIFYIGTNIFLMFNTVYLRRKQDVHVSGFRSFFGPAVQLRMDVESKDYHIRHDTTYFMLLTLFVCTIFLFVELGLSERSCDISCADYI